MRDRVGFSLSSFYTDDAARVSHMERQVIGWPKAAGPYGRSYTVQAARSSCDAHRGALGVNQSDVDKKLRIGQERCILASDGAVYSLGKRV